MNKKSCSSKSTNSTASTDSKRNSIVISKLRRLKIEENLLLQGLQKLDRKRNYEMTESYLTNDSDCRNIFKNLNDSYLNIKNLFDDVKVVTCSQELLAELEIEDIKKKVLELEKTLKSFKVYINTELSSLKITEEELTREMQEVHLKESNSNSKRGKIPSANYNQVVPSPVRLLMTSPFKCMEVQEFQDFMKNSPNRYGGWNEYHHNIFVKYWQKYFGNCAVTDLNDNLFVGNLAHENFVEETLFKLQGVNKECLRSHIEWYKKFLILKDKQQKAIEKWKSNKRSIKKLTRKVVLTNLEQGRPTNDNTLSAEDMPDIEIIPWQNSQCLETRKKSTKQTKPVPKLIGQNDTKRLMKPTKQWLNRNYEEEQIKQQMHFIENLEKLRIPAWRKYLT